jgi:hypothetical protein
MIKFNSIRLDGSKVVVTGDVSSDGNLVRRVSFTLVQPGATAEGDARLQGGGGFVGETDAGGLQPGSVTAVGLSVFLDPKADPVSVETRTWCETLELASR